MTPPTDAPRRSARAVLFDEDGRVVLIRRTRPSGETYLTTPGGGVEAAETWPAAVTRECAEELGADVLVGPEVWSMRWASSAPGTLLRFFLARLDGLDERRRTGPEFTEPWRGTYETVRLDLDDPQLDGLRPVELVAILRDRGGQLAAEAAALGR